ncbi:response regulator [Chloroflexota bacterium]
MDIKEFEEMMRRWGIEPPEDFHPRKRINQAEILAVDDDELYLEFVSKLLIAEGYEVDTAVDGIDALAMIKFNRYNLLLTGICMPYMNGCELYEYVKRIAPSLAEKTIVISGSLNRVDTREFLAGNKLTYMIKPFYAEQLKRVVNRILTQGMR